MNCLINNYLKYFLNIETSNITKNVSNSEIVEHFVIYYIIKFKNHTVL